MSQAATERLTPRVLLVLVLLIGLTTAPHLWHLSPRITGLFYLMLLFRLLMIPFPRFLPNKWLLFALLLVSLANVFVDAGLVGPKYAGVSLLTAMTGLKLLESRDTRDVYVLAFLGFFVMITQFLFEQGMGFSLYFFAISLGLIAVLLDLNAGGSARQVSVNALRLFLSSIPAMVVLFVLFPRLASPLWSFDIEDSTATTGITDQIRPGQVSQLSQSTATAFRVRFEGAPPPPEQRYWRGPVLWETDGATWSAIDDLPYETPGYEADGTLYQYALTMEPTNQQWVFPLELPNAPAKGGFWTAGFQMRTNAPIKTRTSYQLASYVESRLSSTAAWEQELALRLPSNITQRMRQLVAGWRSKTNTDLGLVQMALDHFTTQPFVYTLSPPLLGDNPSDEFLFETRKGFCGHYATSFATLMRVAGIPARVIAGYQGGEMNPLGGHLIVRQSDAHAWVEVWIDDQGAQGWTRIDPTAAVSPDRIEQSVAAQTGPEGTPVLFKLRNLGALGSMMREAGWMLDNLDLQWHRWIVGFSHQSQRWLLDELGLSFLQGYWLGIAAVLGGLIALVVGLLLIRMKSGSKRDPVLRLYRRFRQRLMNTGLDVPPWLGPRALEQRAGRAFPKWAGDIRQITDLYVGLRYSKEVTPLIQRQFRNRVWLFLLLRWRLFPNLSRQNQVNSPLTSPKD